MSKEIMFDVQAREKIMQGVNLLADSVKVTLGPSGKNVMIANGHGAPTVTKDGVTVATVKYNVNAYIASKYQSADIVKTLSQYGVSAKKYATYQNDGDINFGDNEDFSTVKPANPDSDMTFGDSEIF